jgi:radical SAM/CxCxxxxC motif protein YfkAB
MLFGTLPFYACSPDERDRKLIKMMRQAPNLSIRNDPDGQNRLNIDAFTGDIRVTDFADVPPLGNIQRNGLEETFERWMGHPLRQKYACHCPEATCTGPNLLVAHSYYQDVDFTYRKAITD